MSLLASKSIGKTHGKSGGWRAVVCAALGAVVCLALVSGSVRAADDDEEEPTAEEKVIDSILKGMGLRDSRPNIDYRERSPLVIPPASVLPAPETARVNTDPNWPVEPEVRQARETKKRAKSPYLSGDFLTDQARALRPEEMAPGRRPPRQTAGQTQAQTDQDPSRPKLLTPGELGTRPGLFTNMFSAREEVVPFTGEPPRTSLIEPPAGYRTPSPAQPYGVGRAKSLYQTRDEHFLTRSEPQR